MEKRRSELRTGSLSSCCLSLRVPGSNSNNDILSCMYVGGL